MRHNVHATPVAREDGRVIWFASECRRNGIRLESCVRVAENAGDPELAAFFERARRAGEGGAGDAAVTLAVLDGVAELGFVARRV